MARHPARHLNWAHVESSNVDAVAYDNRGMYVRYKGSGDVYFYPGVSRQRAVACRDAISCGRYVNRKIIPSFEAVKIT